MSPADASAALQYWAHESLVWVGFGTIVGLVAKAVLPGRDPGGTVVTLLTGVTGSVIGCGSLVFFLPTQRVTPISPLGFVVATAGAFTLLLFFRLFGGRLPQNQGTPVIVSPRRRPHATPRRRRQATETLDSLLDR